VNTAQPFPIMAAIPHTCTHEYHIVCSDLVIVRWCRKCGETHFVERNVTGGAFPTTWKRARLP
jgi:hypothetical protein